LSLGFSQLYVETCHGIIIIFHFLILLE